MNPSQTELWNCENAFEFICPRKWDSLGQTESPDIRFCEVCKQNVYLCETPLEFVSQGNLGRCVAIRKEVTPGDLFFNHTMGMYLIEGAKREEDWWKGALALNPAFDIEEIDEIRRKLEQRK